MSRLIQKRYRFHTDFRRILNPGDTIVRSTEVSVDVAEYEFPRPVGNPAEIGELELLLFGDTACPGFQIRRGDDSVRITYPENTPFARIHREK